jgi:hypothetical protein
MSATARLAGFGLILVAVLTSAYGVGAALASDRGYALRLESTGLSAGRSVSVAFTITGPDGRPLRSYDAEHEKQLHLIAVRRDVAGYQHVHPARDQYRVSLDGAPRVGMQAELSFSVDRDDRAVVPEPYLGARGHLVALREGDLAYLHVHPAEDSLSFAATFPTAGRYRLFLDMKVDGEVRTVPFTVEVGA